MSARPGNRPLLRTLNRLFAWTGLTLVEHESVKMLIEQANVVESFHPSRTGAASWLRHVARVMPLTETDRNSKTVKEFRRYGR
jgi:hypothetical protein